MAIYLGKISDHASFQYRFLSESDLDALKARRITRYQSMIEAVKQNKDFDRYLRYERKLRKMIVSGRYNYERLRYLMARVREMRWMIEEEFGQIDGQSVSLLPSPEGYAQELWKNAKDSALAEQRRAQREARRRKMYVTIDRSEASYDDFCPTCCHQWTDDDHDECRGLCICPECGEKIWDDEESW